MSHLSAGQGGNGSESFWVKAARGKTGGKSVRIAKRGRLCLSRRSATLLATAANTAGLPVAIVMGTLGGIIGFGMEIGNPRANLLMVLGNAMMGAGIGVMLSPLVAMMFGGRRELRLDADPLADAAEYDGRRGTLRLTFSDGKTTAVRLASRDAEESGRLLNALRECYGERLRVTS